MITSLIVDDLKSFAKKTDWKLLLFLVIFLNVKLAVKLVALILIYLLRFNLKFNFRLRQSRLPLFYIFIPLIGIVNWLLNSAYTYTDTNQNVSFLVGIAGWIACILVIHQLTLSVENYDTTTIHNTIFAFFVLNILFSLGNYLYMVIGSGELNPYIYQGQYQKYFINTGDKIRGISFDTSTTNAVLSAVGVVYFLNRKKIGMVILNMIVLLLTTSNFTNLLIVAVLIYLFIFQTDRLQKSLVAICIMLLMIFITKISPQNDTYTITAIRKMFNKPAQSKPAGAAISIREIPDSLLTADQKKDKIAQLYLDSVARAAIEEKKAFSTTIPSAPEIKSFEPNIHTPPFQRKRDTTQQQKLLRTVAVQIHSDSVLQKYRREQNLPGKVIAFKQTLEFLKKNPSKVVTGTGIGNFSSKLAFRKTGLGVAGGYPKRFTYVNKDFRENHLAIFLYYFGRDIERHSIINTPNSVYDQLLSEYGLPGIFCLLVFYFGFFVRKMKKRSLTLPLLILMLGIFFVDYWFEQFSVIMIFELIILLEMKENNLASNKSEAGNGN